MGQNLLAGEVQNLHPFSLISAVVVKLKIF